MPSRIGPTDNYLVLLKAVQEFHKRSKLFTGLYIRYYIKSIKDIVDRLECKTMLDYGCGKGQQWTTPYNPDRGRFDPDNGIPLADYFGVQVLKYDPGVERFSKEPKGKYDIVICTQVLGAIPKTDVTWVVRKMFLLANKAIFISCAGCQVQIQKRYFRKYQDVTAAGWTREEFVDAIRSGGKGFKGIECWFQAPKGTKPERII